MVRATIQTQLQARLYILAILLSAAIGIIYSHQILMNSLKDTISTDKESIALGRYMITCLIYGLIAYSCLIKKNRSL